MKTYIGTSSSRFPKVLRRFAVRVMMFASLAALAESSLPFLPAQAHNDRPPIDTNCIYWNFQNDSNISINRSGFWYYESLSPDTSYATRNVSSKCGKYWNVGVYYATNRSVQIGADWGDSWLTDEASCVHSSVVYYVWGWRNGTYTPVGGGSLNGRWNNGRCSYSSAPPYGTGSHSIFSSAYSYYRVSAEAYRHGGCPNGAFQCPQKVRVWMYTY